MNEWKEIAVAWGIAVALLFVGIEVAEIASGQPPAAPAQAVLRFAEGLPGKPADAPASDDDFR